VLRGSTVLATNVLPASNGVYTASIALIEGDNDIIAVANNRTGNSAPSNTRSIRYLREFPRLAIEAARRDD